MNDPYQRNEDYTGVRPLPYRRMWTKQIRSHQRHYLYLRLHLARQMLSKKMNPLVCALCEVALDTDSGAIQIALRLQAHPTEILTVVAVLTRKGIIGGDKTRRNGGMTRMDPKDKTLTKRQE